MEEYRMTRSRSAHTGEVKVAAILPCYKSRAHAAGVIAGIGPEVDRIYAIDDCCPEGTGKHIQETVSDPRVMVHFHEVNMGVGGAVKTGYDLALKDGCGIMVKIDSDGQMDPRLIPQLIRPILMEAADYVKGNRFYNPEDVRDMPRTRLYGNMGLSFLTKLSSGYWNIFDPTNGFTAIHATALRALPMDKISNRFFFETDMLFRLNLAAAVVRDMPMRAVYGDEVSNLNVRKALFEFGIKHVGIFLKRIVYQYFLRDFGFGSFCLLFGLPLLLFGTLFGAYGFLRSLSTGVLATPGTVMLAALPVIVGLQFLFGFFAQDQNAVPRVPLQILRDVWSPAERTPDMETK